MLLRNWMPSSFEPSLVMVGAVHSLTKCHVDAVTDALPIGWSVDQHQDYDGYLSIVVTRANDSGTGITFLISGTTGQIELAELRDDVLSHAGRFNTIEATVAGLITALAPQPST